jgi:hypothetical protein
MIYKRPLRRTTLHLAQRLRIEDDTFIITFPSYWPGLKPQPKI